jgi:DNA 3'-phosphatase
MESVAFFEKKVSLSAKHLNKIGKGGTITNMLQTKLRETLENRCSEHGFVIPDSVEIISRSMGYFEPGRFTGDALYHVKAKGRVYYPVDGAIIEGKVLRKNKMGLYVTYEKGLRIQIPRDLHLGNEEFESVQIGDTVEVELKKSLFQVNDPYILVNGLFKKKIRDGTEDEEGSDQGVVENVPTAPPRPAESRAEAEEGAEEEEGDGGDTDLGTESEKEEEELPKPDKPKNKNKDEEEEELRIFDMPTNENEEEEGEEGEEEEGEEEEEEEGEEEWTPPDPEITDKYVVYPSTNCPVKKNAGGNATLLLFDVDGTLVTSKKGRRYALDADDWIFLGDVPKVLNEFKEAGWTIALVSNQADWSKKTDQIRGKFESILSELEEANGWTPWLLLATGAKDTEYRKPGRGLYDLLLQKLELTEDTVGDKRMIGDAAGKEESSFPPYQWSDSDSKFAKAIGADFMLPNDPVYFGSSGPIQPSESQELVLLMGNPGSGKSTTAKALAEKGYIHVEQDVTKTTKKSVDAAYAALEADKSVVMDATNASKVNRALYEDVANEFEISFRIVWHIRDGRPFNALRNKPVPEVAYANYTNTFVEPEGDNVELVY